MDTKTLSYICSLVINRFITKKIVMDNTNHIMSGMEGDIQLLSFLRSKSIERYSKFDAFCDLYDRMIGHIIKQTQEEKDGDHPVYSGCFVASISELADKWHWHRATVRTFIDSLANMGYLSKELIGKDYHFTLKIKANIQVPYSGGDSFLEMARHLACNFASLGYSDELIASYIEAHYSVMSNNFSGKDKEKELAKHKANTILSLIGNMEETVYLVLGKNDELEQVIQDTFLPPHSWSWNKWVHGMKYLTYALVEDEFTGEPMLPWHPTRAVDLRGFTDEETDTLKRVFTLIKATGYGIPDSNDEDEGGSPSEESPSSL